MFKEEKSENWKDLIVCRSGDRMGYRHRIYCVQIRTKKKENKNNFIFKVSSRIIKDYDIILTKSSNSCKPSKGKICKRKIIKISDNKIRKGKENNELTWYCSNHIEITRWNISTSYFKDNNKILKLSKKYENMVKHKSFLTLFTILAMFLNQFISRRLIKTNFLEKSLNISLSG